MVVQLAKPRDVDPRKGPLYQIAPQPTAPQEKSAAGQITDMITDKAMSETVDYGATKLNESVIQPGLKKASAMFSPAATAPASSFTSAPFASANIGPGGGMSGAFSPTVLPAELTGTMMSGTVPGTVASTVAPAAASTVAPAVASTVAPATVAAGAGPLAAMMASPLAPLAIGALAGKAFGLFNKGGHVGPLYSAEGSNGPLPISPREMYNKKLTEYYKLGADLGIVQDEEAAAKKEAYEQTLLGKIFGGGTGVDLQGRENANKFARMQIALQNPELTQRVDPNNTTLNEQRKRKALGNLIEQSDAAVRMADSPLQDYFSMFKSKGGMADPLYASEGRKAVEGESIKDQLSSLLMDKFIEEQEKIQNEIEQSRYKYGGGMAGPLSKVEYKSAGGETYKLSYGGPISKGV